MRYKFNCKGWRSEDRRYENKFKSKKSRRYSVEQLFDFCFDFGLLEGLALDLAVAFGVDQKFCAQEHHELAHIHFRDEDFFVALQNIAEIARQGIQIAQVDMADAVAFLAHGFHGGGDWSGCRTPGDDQQIARRIAFGNDFGNILRNPFDFFGAGANHVFVVQRLVVDVAGDVLLFDAADAMLEAGGAGNGPRAREGGRITLVREKAFGIRLKVHRNLRQFRDGGNLPRLGAVGEIAVGENNHWHHVFDGDTARFEGNPKTVAGR